ncbi:MAG: glycosyltransferase [Candidatus Hermodarchaeota archaeon]
MKLLFVGTFLKAQSTHYPIVRELKRKKIDVYIFKFRQFAFNHINIKSYWYKRKVRIAIESFIKRRPYLPNKIKNLKYYIFGNWYMNRTLLSIVKKNRFDVVFLAKADTVNYNLIKKFNQYSKTFFYFMDPIEGAYAVNAFKYASLATWSSASTTAMTALFKKFGGNSYHILEVYDENIYNPGEENKSKEIDVIFVGRGLPQRKHYINYLRNNRINVVCHGPKWENKSIYFNDLILKYRKSKIILNFPRADTGFSDRVFHVLGTGSFLLSKYCSDLNRIFQRGVHMDWFETPEECLKLIKYYLKNEEIREKIAQQGYNYVVNNFTWKQTVEKILQIINQN